MPTRVALVGTVFALLALWQNREGGLRFWLAGGTWVLFVLFAGSVERIRADSNRDSANTFFFAGSEVFALGTMAAAGFSPSALCAIPVSILFFEAFTEGESRPFVTALLVTQVSVAVLAGAESLGILAAGVTGLCAHWFGTACHGEQRDREANLKAAVHTLRQTREQLRNATQLEEMRSTELLQAHQRIDALERHAVKQRELANLGQLATGIALEMDAPLTSILDFAQGMDPLLQEDDDVRTVIRDSLRCRALTQDLLAIAEATQGQRHRVDVNALMRGVAHRLEARAARQGAVLAVDLPPEALSLMGQPVRLQQVVLELANGALDKLGAGNTLTLRARHGWDDGLALEIEDDGPGTVSQLGSNLAHEILREHGALLDVRRTVGKGTKASINFPLADIDRTQVD